MRSLAQPIESHTQHPHPIFMKPLLYAGAPL